MVYCWHVCSKVAFAFDTPLSTACFAHECFKLTCQLDHYFMEAITLRPFNRYNEAQQHALALSSFSLI